MFALNTIVTPCWIFLGLTSKLIFPCMGHLLFGISHRFTGLGFPPSSAPVHPIRVYTSFFVYLLFCPSTLSHPMEVNLNDMQHHNPFCVWSNLLISLIYLNLVENLEFYASVLQRLILNGIGFLC